MKSVSRVVRVYYKVDTKKTLLTLVIPKKIRDRLNLLGADYLTMTVKEPNSIMLSPTHGLNNLQKIQMKNDALEENQHPTRFSTQNLSKRLA